MEGVVQKLLTKSPTHPHGIKVMLTTGKVGRVQKIINKNIPREMRGMFFDLILDDQSLVKRTAATMPAPACTDNPGVNSTIMTLGGIFSDSRSAFSRAAAPSRLLM